jgi:hypothetical protein
MSIRVSVDGLASLQNRRQLPGKPNTFIYDVLLACADDERDGVASSRHYIAGDKTEKEDGFYMINSKVRRSFQKYK